MCDKKCKYGKANQPITLGRLAVELNQFSMVYKKGTTLYHKAIVFDFPDQAPESIKEDGGRLLVVPVGGGKRYFASVFNTDIQFEIDRDKGGERVWVDTPRSSDRSPHAPKDSQAKIGVVGVKDNGEEIILITAYLG